MPANLLTCADCTTQYAIDLHACPHCGSRSCAKDEGTAARRFPSFVTVRCTHCMNGPWTVRLEARTTGLIELPTLACTSCGRRVSFTWPPEEEPMSPKITVHGGATNARETDVSPVVVASQPQVVAEDDLGRPASEDPAVLVPEPVEPVAEADGVAAAEPPADYDSMTLAELREAAAARDLPSYGTKAQITERLRENDAP